jgi:hypothetical protein
MLFLAGESLSSLQTDLVLDDLDFDLAGGFPLDFDLEDLPLDLDPDDFLSSSLEELAPESLDEGLGLGLPLLFSTFLCLPLTPPSLSNLAMDDPSVEAWGDLDLFMSWNLGSTRSWLDWESLGFALGKRTWLLRGGASSILSSFSQTLWARLSKISLSGAS